MWQFDLYVHSMNENKWLCLDLLRHFLWHSFFRNIYVIDWILLIHIYISKIFSFWSHLFTSLNLENVIYVLLWLTITAGFFTSLHLFNPSLSHLTFNMNFFSFFQLCFLTPIYHRFYYKKIKLVNFRFVKFYKEKRYNILS